MSYIYNCLGGICMDFYYKIIYLYICQLEKDIFQI